MCRHKRQPATNTPGATAKSVRGRHTTPPPTRGCLLGGSLCVHLPSPCTAVAGSTDKRFLSAPLSPLLGFWLVCVGSLLARSIDSLVRVSRRAAGGTARLLDGENRRGRPGGVVSVVCLCCCGCGGALVWCGWLVLVGSRTVVLFHQPEKSSSSISPNRGEKKILFSSRNDRFDFHTGRQKTHHPSTPPTQHATQHARAPSPLPPHQKEGGKRAERSRNATTTAQDATGGEESGSRDDVSRREGKPRAKRERPFLHRASRWGADGVFVVSQRGHHQRWCGHCRASVGRRSCVWQKTNNDPVLCVSGHGQTKLVRDTPRPQPHLVCGLWAGGPHTRAKAKPTTTARFPLSVRRQAKRRVSPRLPSPRLGCLRDRGCTKWPRVIAPTEVASFVVWCGWEFVPGTGACGLPLVLV